MKISEIRAKFPAAEQSVYLDSAAVGLISKETAKAGSQSFEALLESGSTYSNNFMETHLVDIKKQCTQFFNCKDEEMVFIPSFSYGINLLLTGIPKPAKVLILEKDYPSVTLPISEGSFVCFTEKAESNGFYAIEKLKERIRHVKPLLFICSHVQYNSGQRLPIEELSEVCKEVGCHLIVDATQSAGVFPIDFTKTQAAAILFSNYKWMNAGFGNGLMMVKNEFLQLYPAKTGGFGSTTWENNKMLVNEGISRMQPAHYSKATLAALSESIKLHDAVGQEKIWKHNQKLLGKFLDATFEKLPILGTGEISDYSSFCLIQDTEGNLSTQLHQANIKHTLRNGLLRLGFHFYNNSKDLKKLLQVILD